MLTPAGFRRIVLALEGAVEGAHMGHADFRAGGRIFASLGCPDDRRAVVKVSPADQKSLTTARPDVFQPAKGAWGVGGATVVQLRRTPAALVRTALDAALRLATTPRPRRSPASTARRPSSARRGARSAR